MMSWWNSLSAVNQYLYLAAAFFSLFFLWQLISAIIGLSAHDGADMTTHIDVAADHSPDDATAHADAQDTIAALKLLSFRSIVAFFTMFFWAGALYVNNGMAAARALSYGVLWGLGAMVLVSLLMYWMSRLTETGNPRLASAVGTIGTVYLDIPAGGPGEVRAMVSGVVTHLRAITRSGQPLKAGAAVRVLAIRDTNLVEVEPLDASTSQGK